MLSVNYTLTNRIPVAFICDDPSPGCSAMINQAIRHNLNAKQLGEENLTTWLLVRILGGVKSLEAKSRELLTLFFACHHHRCHNVSSRQTSVWLKYFFSGSWSSISVPSRSGFCNDKAILHKWKIKLAQGMAFFARCYIHGSCLNILLLVIMSGYRSKAEPFGVYWLLLMCTSVHVTIHVLHFWIVVFYAVGNYLSLYLIFLFNSSLNFSTLTTVVSSIMWMDISRKSF